MTAALSRRRLLVAGAGIASVFGGVARAQTAVPIADMHTHLGKQTRAAMAKDLAADMKANNVVLAAWAYATDKAYIKAMPDGIRQVSEPVPMKIAMAMREEMRSSQRYLKDAGLGLVLTASDVDRALTGHSSVVLAAEGTDFMQGRMSLLDEAFDGGLRHLQLVHYTRNVVGDFQTEEPRHGGLTDFGRQLIRVAQAKGMLVDLAHCTEPGVRQALEVATKPMVWSHGWVDKVPGAHDDKAGWQRRRLSLATAREIAKAGGVVGLWGLGLKRPNRSWPVGVNDPEGYGKAMLALVEQLGADHVAFGTDIAGVGDSGSVNTYSEVQLVIQALQRGGLDAAAIAKVSHLNYARVLRTAVG